MKNVLLHFFNRNLNISSPIQVDFARKVSFDEKGNEHVTWESVDYPKIQRSLGTVNDWSLNNLLKAGINPDFPIHTGYGTRIDALNDINTISADVNLFFSKDIDVTTPKES